MARPRAFDPEQAIDAVMRVFWHKGFAETSYSDLVEASGVSRKGLYTAFGDKEALFVAALRHYRQTVFKALFSTLDEEEISVESISEMLREFGQLAASEAGSSGCFMANTALDDTLRIAEVRCQVDSHLSAMSQSFSEAFLRAGLTTQKAKTLGHYFTGIMQGLFLLAHARASQEMIESYISVAVSAL